MGIIIQRTKGHLLPGNTEDKVLVEGRLYVYLKTFEKFIKKNPSVEYRTYLALGLRLKMYLTWILMRPLNGLAIIHRAKFHS